MTNDPPRRNNFALANQFSAACATVARIVSTSTNEATENTEPAVIDVNRVNLTSIPR